MPKIAVIGLGGMGRHHARVLTQVLGHKIAAASDTFPEARDRFAADYPEAQMFEDHRALLAKAKPDVAWICLPTFLHKEATIDCAQAGVHVMVEKPMALTTEECLAMDAAAKKAKIKLMPAFCRRFDNHWGTLKRIIADESLLGRPIVWRQLAGGGSPGPTWFVQKDKGGGPFIDGCVHNHDFCLWTFGKAVSVKSSLITMGKGTCLDTGMADIVFEKGDRTTLNWSWGCPKGSQSARGEDVLGSTGVLHFGIPEKHRPAGFDPAKQDGFHIYREGGAVEVHTFEKNDMYAGEDKHFLDCIASNKEPSVTAADGLAATQIAERIFADAERKGS